MRRQIGNVLVLRRSRKSEGTGSDGDVIAASVGVESVGGRPSRIPVFVAEVELDPLSVVQVVRVVRRAIYGQPKDLLGFAVGEGVLAHKPFGTVARDVVARSQTGVVVRTSIEVASTVGIPAAKRTPTHARRELRNEPADAGGEVSLAGSALADEGSGHGRQSVRHGHGLRIAGLANPFLGDGG